MIKNYCNKVMDYEYNTFMTLMNVSVSKHLLDEHFTVLWANDYFYKLIGYAKDEYEALYHNHVDEYYKDDPDSIAFMAQIITQAYQQNDPGYEFECPMHVKGGGTAWIRVTGRFTDETFAGIPVVYTIYTDITKLKEMQRQLEKQSEQLTAALEMTRKANRAKSDFLSQMSHDIRTPMNAIIGMTNIAAMHIDDPQKVKNCLKKISLSSQHLLGLINDVLDMSKIESGAIALNREHFSLPVMLDKIVSIMQPVFKDKNQHFQIQLKHVAHEDFMGDSLRMRQIFLNILSNASKFTPENGFIRFTIEESPSDQPGHALFHFTFSDSGIGIRPEFLPHVFEVFTREKDSRVDTIEGTGLGMAIAKNLTELLGGSIQVESQAGQGATFKITLPLNIAATPDQPLIGENLKVLVVDNDDIACEYQTETLREWGAEASWAKSGGEAVEKITEAHAAGRDFDMVLLDWQMPGMDGVQTARAIRAAVGENIPVLLVSAYDWDDIESEALQGGINGFLQKPLFKSTLSRGIQNHTGKRPSRRPPEKPHSFQGKRLLLVEDNRLNREIAVEMLGTMGATVETAPDGAAGAAQFRQSAEGYYDLILMDIQMPVMNGYDATRNIRALPRPDAARIPIIAITADAFAEDVEAAKQAGMNGHLPKPFDMTSLNRELGKFL